LQLGLPPLTIPLDFAADTHLPLIGCRPHGVAPRRRCRKAPRSSTKSVRASSQAEPWSGQAAPLHADVPGEGKDRNFLYARAAYPDRLKKVCSSYRCTVGAGQPTGPAGWEWGSILLLLADDYSSLSPYLCVHPAMDGRAGGRIYSGVQRNQIPLYPAQHVTYRPSLTRGELHRPPPRRRSAQQLALPVRSRIELLAAPSRR
jgi:hypothetical protein